MTIDELHDYCRYLFDENHEQGNLICRVHPLRRDGGHILRDLPVLRIQTGCAQSATKGEMCGLTQVTTD